MTVVREQVVGRYRRLPEEDEPGEPMTKKVTVEVIEGSYAWAYAMEDQGKEVLDYRGLNRYPSSVDGQDSCFASGWTLAPEKPLTVVPGTWDWAVIQYGNDVSTYCEVGGYKYYMHPALPIFQSDHPARKATNWRLA